MAICRGVPDKGRTRGKRRSGCGLSRVDKKGVSVGCLSS